MPVLTIEESELAVPLAEALVAGGMRAVEVTLRTPVAIAAIANIRQALPELIVGAGTVVTPRLMHEVQKAGGQFAVSPGFSTALGAAAQECGLPFLPGVVTASEIQIAMEHGLENLKFFPAEHAGGVKLLSSYASVFADIRFCPTGGIREDNMAHYLELSNVTCVGGSWIAPRDMIAKQNWNSISKRAAKAMSAVNE